ncbi:MAG: SpoIID/LytB domain-containing protein [Planctomycetota bacterium]
MLRAFFAVLAGLVSATELMACALPPAPQAPAPAREPAQARPTAPPAARPAAPPVARLPVLDHEPVLGVLIARAPRVVVEVRTSAELVAGNTRRTLAPGGYSFSARAGVLTLDGQSWRESLTLAGGGEPCFALDATPKFGPPRRLTLAGELVVRADGDELEVIERIPMEAYLASVVGAEMNAKWPAAALAAQAIVARSYAAARWMEKSGEPWQLHWHFGVDMAYHGWSESNATVARAIASTRGEVLMHAGFPVLALFHASSGGRTESFERIKPGVFAPDKKTPIAAAMPVVTDDAALLGAEGLKLSATHGRWKADLPLPEVGAALQKWASADKSRPRFGTLEAVSIAARHDDSGRVKSVSLRHALDGQTRFTELAATDFRMAVSPVKIRSLAWDRCVIAAKEPGYLVLEGRGFGHGCGLSQVSAWYLATQGESPERIVARFYAGAKIERRY